MGKQAQERIFVCVVSTLNAPTTTSVEKFVLESFSVPVAVFVEHEDFLGVCVPEDQVRVKRVDHPHDRSTDLLRVDFLQVANVDDVADHATEEASFVEDYLLSVWQELRMPAEVTHHAQLSWQLGGQREKRHRGEELPSQEVQSKAEEGVVRELTGDNIAGFRGLVKMDSILMCLNACKATVVVRVSAPDSDGRTHFPKQTVAQHWHCIEHIVCGILLNLVIGEDFIAVDGPFAGDPGVKFLTEDALLGQLVVHIGLRGKLIGHVLTIDLMHGVLVIWIASWSAKRSHSQTAIKVPLISQKR